MKKFLVFIEYLGQIQVNQERYPEDWTNDFCVERIRATHKDIVSIQPYDVFIVSL